MRDFYEFLGSLQRVLRRLTEVNWEIAKWIISLGFVAWILWHTLSSLAASR